MKNNSKTVSLDEELKLLLLSYQREEVDFYKEIINDVDVYQAENMVTYNIVTQEDGSNG